MLIVSQSKNVICILPVLSIMVKINIEILTKLPKEYNLLEQKHIFIDEC